MTPCVFAARNKINILGSDKGSSTVQIASPFIEDAFVSSLQVQYGEFNIRSASGQQCAISDPPDHLATTFLLAPSAVYFTSNSHVEIGLDLGRWHTDRHVFEIDFGNCSILNYPDTFRSPRLHINANDCSGTVRFSVLLADLQSCNATVVSDSNTDEFDAVGFGVDIKVKLADNGVPLTLKMAETRLNAHLTEDAGAAIVFTQPRVTSESVRVVVETNPEEVSKVFVNFATDAKYRGVEGTEGEVIFTPHLPTSDDNDSAETLYTPSPGSISGSVLDSTTLRPIGGMKVTYKGLADPFADSGLMPAAKFITVADDGTFVLGELDPGYYVVCVDFTHPLAGDRVGETWAVSNDPDAYTNGCTEVRVLGGTYTDMGAFEYAPPSTLSGVVTKGVEKEAVADMEVDLVQITGLGDSVTYTVKTTSNGVFHFEGLEDGTYSVQLPATAPHGSVLDDSLPTDRVYIIANGVPVSGIAVQYALSSRITGKMVSVSGDIVEGVRVELLRLSVPVDASSAEANEPIEEVAVSDGDGVFVFANLDPGTYLVTVPDISTSGGSLVEAPTDLTVDMMEEKQVFEVHLMEGDDANIGTFAFSEASGVSGRIINALGMPVQTSISAKSGDTEITTQSTADGFYYFEGLPKGEHTITLNDLPSTMGVTVLTPDDSEFVVQEPVVAGLFSPFSLTSLSTESPDGSITIEFKGTMVTGISFMMQEKGSIAGRMTDSDGTGISGVPVVLTGADGDGDGRATSNALGYFAFDKLPVDGLYKLIAPGFETFLQVDMNTVTQLGSFSAERSGFVTGTVVNAHNGERLKDVDVVLRDYTNEYKAITTTDQTGRFILMSVPYGSYYLSVPTDHEDHEVVHNPDNTISNTYPVEVRQPTVVDVGHFAYSSPATELPDRVEGRVIGTYKVESVQGTVTGTGGLGGSIGHETTVSVEMMGCELGGKYTFKGLSFDSTDNTEAQIVRETTDMSFFLTTGNTCGVAGSKFAPVMKGMVKRANQDYEVDAEGLGAAVGMNDMTYWAIGLWSDEERVEVTKGEITQAKLVAGGVECSSEAVDVLAKLSTTKIETSSVNAFLAAAIAQQQDTQPTEPTVILTSLQLSPAMTCQTDVVREGVANRPGMGLVLHLSINVDYEQRGGYVPEANRFQGHLRRSAAPRLRRRRQAVVKNRDTLTASESFAAHYDTPVVLTAATAAIGSNPLPVLGDTSATEPAAQEPESDFDDSAADAFDDDTSEADGVAVDTDTTQPDFQPDFGLGGLPGGADNSTSSTEVPSWAASEEASIVAQNTASAVPVASVPVATATSVAPATIETSTSVAAETPASVPVETSVSVAAETSTSVAAETSTSVAAVEVPSVMVDREDEAAVTDKDIVGSLVVPDTVADDVDDSDSSAVSASSASDGDDDTDGGSGILHWLIPVLVVLLILVMSYFLMRQYYRARQKARTDAYLAHARGMAGTMAAMPDAQYFDPRNGSSTNISSDPIHSGMHMGMGMQNLGGKKLTHSKTKEVTDKVGAMGERIGKQFKAWGTSMSDMFNKKNEKPLESYNPHSAVTVNKDSMTSIPPNVIWDANDTTNTSSSSHMSVIHKAMGNRPVQPKNTTTSGFGQGVTKLFGYGGSKNEDSKHSDTPASPDPKPAQGGSLFSKSMGMLGGLGGGRANNMVDVDTGFHTEDDDDNTATRRIKNIDYSNMSFGVSRTPEQLRSQRNTHVAVVGGNGYAMFNPEASPGAFSPDSVHSADRYLAQRSNQMSGHNPYARTEENAFHSAGEWLSPEREYKVQKSEGKKSSSGLDRGPIAARPRPGVTNNGNSAHPAVPPHITESTADNVFFSPHGSVHGEDIYRDGYSDESDGEVPNLNLSGFSGVAPTSL
ncbi:hypothetical protein SARC_06164 [Sphaeroforma arctica JP610]|uniref:SD-repeat containing protein B domain-containing protein n=1 Tax=Sphaeroforma arctica JP610 TaxID=667725 RepID=A0A0L0FZX3_9EUKA|nr:hypothetical protein SARC_06164 [Sphaeroforma arctica JP610]KNC81518.1 hypothetical protein SARC_06164 [Sphaeroforma arctica JP610]|eukprot:XP_014155420.1 hypothetical protein SARC_06164 [Sphaeroforma arctica JP610]